MFYKKVLCNKAPVTLLKKEALTQFFSIGFLVFSSNFLSFQFS